MTKSNNKNLYYPVFRSIENEVVELSRVIYFSDEQVNVYSVKISELLSRCSIEIESLLKDLYRREFSGKDPESVGMAVNILDEKWSIAKKELKITNDNFYFTSSFAPYFTPMGYKSKSKNDYYAAYNAIKHDRAKNLQKANINTLLRALGSLYILNLYFAESTLNSDVFTAKIAGQATGIYIDLGMNLKKFLDSCVLIEYNEFAYPLWQEINHKNMSFMVKSLKVHEKKLLLDEIKKHSSNVFRIFNKLFELSNTSITVGDLLRDSLKASNSFIDNEPSIAINNGYVRVYLTVSDMKKTMNKIKNGKSILSWNKTLHTIKEYSYKR